MSALPLLKNLEEMWKQIGQLRRDLDRLASLDAVQALSSSAPHSLNNTSVHLGTLADGQATQFLKTDGSRALTGNMAVDPNVTIDGVDISAHAADANAHGSRTAARISRAANYTIGWNNWLVLPFTAEDYDNGSYADLGTNNDRLVIPSNGVYAIGAVVIFDNASTVGMRGVCFVANDTTSLAIAQLQALMAGSTPVNCYIEVQLSAGDYVKCSVIQTSGQNLDILGTTQSGVSPRFFIHKVVP